MDPKTSASQKLRQLLLVVNRTRILHALEKMNGEPINIDNSSDEQRDCIEENIQHDIATCPRPTGFESLRNFGTDSTIETQNANFYFGSNSQTNIPTMT